MAVVIRCPACKTKFRWLAETEGYPSNCPQCDAYVGHDRADDDVVMPNILAFSTRCQDGVYKAMEKSSEQRMYEAAEMAGCSPSEMSDLKITNLRDNMKQGEIAAMPVVNDVTRQMEAFPSNSPFGFNGGPSAGLGYSGTVSTGPFPNAGARTQTLVRESHAIATNYTAVGDRPANEIFNPGYRRRV
jgi:hypothetical protein